MKTNYLNRALSVLLSVALVLASAASFALMAPVSALASGGEVGRPGIIDGFDDGYDLYERAEGITLDDGVDYCCDGSDLILNDFYVSSPWSSISSAWLVSISNYDTGASYASMQMLDDSLSYASRVNDNLRISCALLDYGISTPFHVVIEEVDYLTGAGGAHIDFYVFPSDHAAPALSGSGSGSSGSTDSGMSHISIVPSGNSSPKGYVIMPLFTCDITADGSAYNFAFASPTVKEAIMRIALDIGDPVPIPDSMKDELGMILDLSNEALAQLCAQYVAEHIDGTPEGFHSGSTYVPGGSFAMKLARFMSNDTYHQGYSFLYTDEGEVSEAVPYGYYLICSGDLDSVRSINEGSGDFSSFDFTAPIYAFASRDSVTIYEKSAAPAVSFFVKDDASSEFVKEADQTSECALLYKVEAHMPENIASYDAYKFVFKLDGITVPVKAPNATTFSGLLRVIVDGFDLPPSLWFSGPNSITIPDLSSIPIPKKGHIDADSVVEVQFSASIATSSVAPKIPSVYVDYPNNPVYPSSDEFRGQSVASSVRVYAYDLNLSKTDKQTGRALDGVGFTVQNSAGKYLALNDSIIEAARKALQTAQDSGRQDPALIATREKALAAALSRIYEQDAPYTFYTDEAGALTLANVDADTYTIEEIAPREDYKGLDDSFGLLIVPSSDRLNVTYSLADEDPALVSLDASTVAVKNIAILHLPITGEAGIVLCVALGAALLGVGIFCIVRNRRRSSFLSDDVEE